MIGVIKIRWMSHSTGEKYIKIVILLSQNARMTYTEISRKTGIPVSTIFDIFKNHIEPEYDFVMIKKR